MKRTQTTFLICGLVFAALVYIWLSAGLWYIDQFGFPSP